MDYLINEPSWLYNVPDFLWWSGGPAPPGALLRGSAQHPAELLDTVVIKRQLITTQCKGATAEISAIFRCIKQLFPRLFVDRSVCCAPTFNCFWTPSDICQWDRHWVFEARGFVVRPHELSQNQRQCHVVFSSAEINRALAWKRGEHLHINTLKMPMQSQAWELQACQGRIIPHVEKQMKSQKKNPLLINSWSL